MLPAPFSEYNSTAPPTKTTSTTLLRTSELSSSQSPCRKDGIVQFSIKIFNLDNFISFPAIVAPPNRTSLQHLFFCYQHSVLSFSIWVWVFFSFSLVNSITGSTVIEITSKPKRELFIPDCSSISCDQEARAQSSHPTRVRKSGGKWIVWLFI